MRLTMLKRLKISRKQREPAAMGGRAMYVHSWVSMRSPSLHNNAPGRGQAWAGSHAREANSTQTKKITAENELLNVFRGLPIFCRTGATRTNSHVIFFFLVLSLMNLTKKHKKLAKH